ncbi:hypothetical protein AVEN_188457-1 [Araneus ventricosus]|uniref:Uncharacterized protein n=1 Tax=Araneus ventricosus TaxID=182803 RepID=A0A4Y2QD71_ARAVE|nr:hypothetical protein AVEN_188457-1 [Araneus ventricosus]
MSRDYEAKLMSNGVVTKWRRNFKTAELIFMVKVDKDASLSLVKILFSDLTKWFERETQVTSFSRLETGLGGQHFCNNEELQGSLPSMKIGTGGSQVRNPIPLKIRRVWGLLHAKSYVVAKRPPVGVAWKFGEGGASSGVVLVI